jgi:UDP-N-acetyl-D-glucosamine dehydrogenase
MRLLSDKGAVLAYNDPFVPSLRLGGNVLKSVDCTAAEISRHDCVIILTDHSVYDFRQIVSAAKLLVDTRNATKELHEFKDRIIKLGAGNYVRSSPDHFDEHSASASELAAH